MSAGNFASPAWLVLLAVLAALAAGYVWVQRRNRRQILRFANFELLSRVMPRTAGWSRHVPAALLAVAVILLVVGMAGPTAHARIPRNRATVMLVIDVSLSMKSTDVEPTRLGAAQQAATKFAHDLTPGINLGLESFSGAPQVLVPPMTDRDPVVQQIGLLRLGPSTATGEALATALNALDNFNRLVPSSGGDGPAPSRIVLMSDGKQTVGRDEFEVARRAQAAKIPITTISFGTASGTVNIDGEDMGVPVDDESLAQVAKLSGGDFFPARSNDQIHKVYDTLSEQIGYQTMKIDVSKPWFTAGTLAVLVAIAAGLTITRRIPA